MPRILVALLVRSLMLVIWMIAIHERSVRQLASIGEY